MKKNSRFLIGVGAAVLVIGYLMWTGIQGTMVYFFTPTELVAKVAEDPTFHQVGVKVAGRVVEGSHVETPGEIFHTFEVFDIEDPSVTFKVEYRDLLPDTFAHGSDVIVEGLFREDGVFEANLVLTKCGSRYEAAPSTGYTASS